MTHDSTTLPEYPFDPALDLLLERVVEVPSHLIWEAWTKPEYLMQWFTPAPWRTTLCEMDLRPGGAFRTVMEGPDGERFDNTGCFLEVIPGRRLVFTDAMKPNFRPSEAPFFTAVITLHPHNGGTRYTAHAMHRDTEGQQKHEAMGFSMGWGKAFDQLVEASRGW